MSWLLLAFLTDRYLGGMCFVKCNSVPTARQMFAVVSEKLHYFAREALFHFTLSTIKVLVKCMFSKNVFNTSPDVAEWLRHRSRKQKFPSSIPRLDITVEVTSQC